MDVSSLFNSVVAIVVTLGVLIAFHEFGHFIMAKALGMGVKTFSVGFGPKLLGFRYGRTRYKLAAIPLGGFVSLVGGEYGEDEELEGFKKHEYFHTRPPWQRFLVVFAGPFFNYLLALILFAILFLAMGEMRALPVIKTVVENSAAASAGFKDGDKITAINGQEIQYWSEMTETIQESEGKELTFTVMREGESQTLTAAAEPAPSMNLFGDPITQWRIGILQDSSQTTTVSLGIFGSIAASWTRCAEIVALSAEAIVRIVTGRVALDQVAGPIGIAQMVHEQAQVGIVAVIAFMCFFSINLALFNLLPIPVLDGGHLLFFLVEWIRGKPVSMAFQEVTSKIGLGILLAIMALALYNDITREGTPREAAMRELEAMRNATLNATQANATQPAIPPTNGTMSVE